MAIVHSNSSIGYNTYKIRILGSFKGSAGQFYMIKTSKTSQPFLLRPISIFDIDNTSISFIYKTIGEGTNLLKEFKQGDEITLNGPYGNGFEIQDQNLTLIGGGIGLAPLLLCAKQLKRKYPNRTVRLYVGFTDEFDAVKYFESYCDTIVTNIRGYIPNEVDYSFDGIYLSVGPDKMMRITYELCKESNKELYVSLETRLACGVGACLGCSIFIKRLNANKKICCDGPVFNAKDVYDD